MTDKVFGSLGLCARAGKLKSGEFQAEESIKSSEAYLVIIAQDASDNTKKKFRNMSSFYEIPLAEYGTKETLGKAIGKEYRSAVTVLDRGFANSILQKLRTTEQ